MSNYNSRRRVKGKLLVPQAPLMDGFYVEVRNIGSKDKAIKLRSESRAEMELNASRYQRNGKEVTVLGEHKNETWLDNSVRKDTAG